MIDQAIAKINAEMQKEPSDRYLEIIGHYLIDRCDEALAAKIKGGKTLKGAMEAVVKNAKQSNVDPGSACLLLLAADRQSAPAGMR